MSSSNWCFLTCIQVSKEKSKFTLVAQSCQTLCDPRDCSMLGFPVYHEMPEFTQTHVHRVSDTTHPSHPLLSPSPPTFSLSQHQSPLNESVLHIRWPKYWSFSFSISLSNEYSRLISIKIDWLDFLAVQGTLKSLLQHCSSKHQFFSAQSSLWYNSDIYKWRLEKTALTIQIFIGKVMSLLSNMLSRLVIAFIPRSKRLLISWLQSPSAVILEPKKIVCHCFHCFPIYFPWSDGTRCHDLRFLNVEF